MIDPRVANLAKILVGYSVQVKEGETCLIEGPTAAEPLIVLLASFPKPLIAPAQGARVRFSSVPWSV